MLHIIYIYLIANMFSLGLIWRYLQKPKIPQIIILGLFGAIIMLYQRYKGRKL